jgi:hypothetical protein
MDRVLTVREEGEEGDEGKGVNESLSLHIHSQS